MDEPAPARVVHVRQRRPRQLERRLQHHGKDSREAVGREVLDRRHVLQAGVVDEHVHGRRRPTWCAQLGERRAVAEVRDERLAADLLGHLLRAVAVEVERDHRRAGLGEPGGAGGPDAAARPGDEHAPAREGRARQVLTR